MTYKELMRELPDDITPEDAQKEYQAYLTEWWGSEVRSIMSLHSVTRAMPTKLIELTRLQH